MIDVSGDSVRQSQHALTLTLNPNPVTLQTSELSPFCRCRSPFILHHIGHVWPRLGTLTATSTSISFISLIFDRIAGKTECRVVMAVGVPVYDCVALKSCMWTCLSVGQSRRDVSGAVTSGMWRILAGDVMLVGCVCCCSSMQLACLSNCPCRVTDYLMQMLKRTCVNNVILYSPGECESWEMTARWQFYRIFKDAHCVTPIIY